MRPVLAAADVRFPLQRANGVQILKTCAALARAGAEVTLLVRQSDPRPTAELLELYGLRPQARLECGACDVGCTAGAFTVPRARFLWQAGWAPSPPPAPGPWSSAATCSSATCCCAWSRRAAPGLRGPRGGGGHVPRARPPVRDRRAPRPAQGPPHRGPRGARLEEGRGPGDDHRRNPRQLRRAARPAAACERRPQRLRRARGPHLPRSGAEPRAARALRRAALPLERGRRAGRGRGPGARRAPGDPGRPARRERPRAGLPARGRAPPGRPGGDARHGPPGAGGRGAAPRRRGGGALPAHRHDRAPHLAAQGLRGPGGRPADRGHGPALLARGARARAQRAARPARRRRGPGGRAAAPAGRRALRERLARQAWADSERYSWDARARALLRLFGELP